MKLSKRFIEDVKWFNSVKNIMNFDGKLNYYNKKGENIIQFDINGINGIEAFYNWDTNGKISKTKHPNILHKLLKIKGSVNLHIQMFAEDRAKGILPYILFEDIIKEFNLPEWVINAVEKQKEKYK